ncbi:hypothetical protein LINPERPRIM_LOCUS489 [Linum perenne]
MFRNVGFSRFEHVDGENNGGGLAFAWIENFHCVVVFSFRYVICVCCEYDDRVFILSWSSFVH